MIDKILVSNNSALMTKYGSGLATIQGAIARVIAADQARGLQSLYVSLDDAAAMQAAAGQPVANPADQQQNKAAVDALYTFYSPQYLVLVGGPDVVSHQDLTNPAYDPPDHDPDQFVPSDLPYACNAGYSQEINDFLGPSRVVSRLPDVTGSNDPGYLVHVLELAAAAIPLTRQDYADYLGVSAQVWSVSTGLSLSAIFGDSANLQSVPPANYQWPQALLGTRSHLFNCHGGSNSPQYLGQDAAGYPVAHDAAYIAGKVTSGTLAAAECCYGAELYDPNGPAGGQMGIANTYMNEGAYGFWGSTTIAYGPAEYNGAADLICQYFMQETLAGASKNSLP